MWTRTWHGTLALLAPARCAACDLRLDGARAGFCAGCSLLVDGAPERGEEPDLDACLYGGPLRDALHRFKYDRRAELAPAFAPWLVDAARRLLGHVDVVTAVPLHTGKLRSRGFNQSLLLARPVARALSVPLAVTLLARPRAATAQRELSREARAAQRGVFVARRTRQRVLVVDDVRTTGATLREARRVLEEAGAERVYTLALAVADRELEARV